MSLENLGRKRVTYQGREHPEPDSSPTAPKSCRVSSGFMDLNFRKKIMTSTDSIHFKFYFFILTSSEDIRSGLLYEGLKTRTLQSQMTPHAPGPKHCWSSEDLTVNIQWMQHQRLNLHWSPRLQHSASFIASQRGGGKPLHFLMHYLSGAH